MARVMEETSFHQCIAASRCDFRGGVSKYMQNNNSPFSPSFCFRHISILAVFVDQMLAFQKGTEIDGQGKDRRSERCVPGRLTYSA